MSTKSGRAPCGLGVSTAKDAAAAASEAVAGAIEAAKGESRCVLVFATANHGDPRPLVKAAAAAAEGATILGCMGSGVVSGSVEVEDGPGVVALAIGRDRDLPDPAPFLGAGPVAVPASPAALAVLLADGYSAHPERLARELVAALPQGQPLVGGLAVGSGTPSPAYRWLGREVSSKAAVGVVIPCAEEPIVGIAQGCRPIGPVRRVTSSRGNVVATLDGRPAFESFAATARPLLDDLRRAAQSIFVAIGDPGESSADRFIIRGLLGFDADRGLIAVSEPLAEGTPLRFAVRDPYAGRESLRTMLEDVKARLGGRRPRFGLYFNCAGRGRALFGVDGHDLAFINGALGSFPLAGVYVGGELGPVAGMTRLLLFSGVLAVVP